MTILPFDEINALALKKKQRSIDIDRFFGEMELPEFEKRERKEFARELNDILFLALATLYILLIRKIEGVTLDGIKSDLSKQISDLAKKYTYPDTELENKIVEYVNGFVDTTANHSTAKKPEDLAYWFSEDRARLNAEDETNDLFNYEQYRQALFDGKTQKQWLTMKDEKVRKTHAEVDDVVIPINDFFQVGEYQMRYPHDSNAGAEETVGCRCSIRYF